MDDDNGSKELKHEAVPGFRKIYYASMIFACGYLVVIFLKLF